MYVLYSDYTIRQFVLDFFVCKQNLCLLRGQHSSYNPHMFESTSETFVGADGTIKLFEAHLTKNFYLRLFDVPLPHGHMT